MDSMMKFFTLYNHFFCKLDHFILMGKIVLNNETVKLTQVNIF